MSKSIYSQIFLMLLLCSGFMPVSLANADEERKISSDEEIKGDRPVESGIVIGKATSAGTMKTTPSGPAVTDDTITAELLIPLGTYQGVIVDPKNLKPLTKMSTLIFRIKLNKDRTLEYCEYYSDDLSTGITCKSDRPFCPGIFKFEDKALVARDIDCSHHTGSKRSLEIDLTNLSKEDLKEKDKETKLIVQLLPFLPEGTNAFFLFKRIE